MPFEAENKNGANLLQGRPSTIAEPDAAHHRDCFVLPFRIFTAFLRGNQEVNAQVCLLTSFYCGLLPCDFLYKYLLRRIP